MYCYSSRLKGLKNLTAYTIHPAECAMGNQIWRVSAVNHNLIAGSIFWAGLGLSGSGWLWGPVRVNTEFLGETHVSSLRCHLTSAAKPGQTFASRVVDAPLEMAQPPKCQINALKMSPVSACRGCLRSFDWHIQSTVC